MVKQEQVKTALHELGGKATIREIVELLILKKQATGPYNYVVASSVSRILQSLKGWQEVDRIIYSDNNHPKDTYQDVWFFRK